ncbi:MAG: response regulator transcription factor [bacterium]|nr:response regulator transcription factor [bacterium]
MSEIRVAIVEDDPRYRESLRTFLGHSAGFSVADVFGSAEKLLARARDVSPRAAAEAWPWTLVLMDIELPGRSGIEATRELRRLYPGVSVVMLTVFEDARVVLEAISAGASGYILKKATARELVEQLQAVMQGGAPLSPAVASTVLDIVRKLNADAPGTDGAPARSPSRLDLTAREQDVLRCLVGGRSYSQTARDLGISEGTVRTHVRSVYRKLQVHSVSQAIRKAMERGLV